jgi:Mlc titration factor MtfA (ptsG expression regulator)
MEGTMRAARKHANQVHHASCRTERVVPLYKPTEEEKKRKAVERTRRWLQKKKVRVLRLLVVETKRGETGAW